VVWLTGAPSGTVSERVLRPKRNGPPFPWCGISFQQTRDVYIEVHPTNRIEEEREKSMTRQTSKGTCSFCHAEVSKSAMTRHLEACQQRAIAEAQAGGRLKAQKTRKFHLVVEGRDLPVYWMHLEVTANTTLATLDRFLRDTWLECCGHLSAFEIGGIRYAIDAGMVDAWGMDEKSMRVRLDKVCSSGQTCSYEYDYGTTTELRLKVISEREVEAKGTQFHQVSLLPYIEKQA
jgi:Plasmid pRiA4b ORF-3-like protein